MKSPIEMMMDGVEWSAEEPPDDSADGLPWATHTGVLRIGSIAIECARLSTGPAVITEDGMRDFCAWLESGVENA